MNYRRFESALSLFLCITFSLSGFSQEEVQPVTGRITGWGYLGPDRRVESTLPSGWNAENVVKVFAGTSSWVALKDNNTVISSAKLPDWLQGIPVRDVDWGTSWGIVATQECRVRTWSTTDARFIAPARELENVIEVEGGYQCAMALRSDGSVAFWGPAYDPGDDPAKKAAFVRLSEFLERELHNVTTINSRQFGCAALRSDGSVVGWNVNGYSFSTTWLEENSVINIDTGSEGSNLALRRDGTVAAAGRNKIPKDLGSVSWLQTGLGGFAMVRLPDGTFRHWGHNKYIRFSTEPERFENLLKVSFGGSYDAPSRASFIVGIEPSYLQGFSGQKTKLPALNHLLVDLEAERIAAGNSVKALENQYLSKLAELKTAAEKSGRTSIVALINHETEHFRDTSRPAISEKKVLEPLQKKYRKAAAIREEKRRNTILGVYKSAVERLEKLEHQLKNSGNSSGAEMTRIQKAKVAAAYELLKNPPVTNIRKIAAASKSPTYSVIPDQNQIFSIDDPVVPGHLYLAGAIKGHILEIPNSGEVRRITQVTAGTEKWYALRPNGEVIAGRHTGLVDLKGDIPRLTTIRENTNKWYGIEKKGLYLSPEAESFQPPVDGKRIVSLEARVHPHDHFAALLDDGSVIAWGPNYERERFPWKLPPGIAERKDFIQIALSNEQVAALSRQGDVVAWGQDGEKKAPKEMSADMVRIVGKADTMVGLKNNGTVVTWGTSATATVPRGLTNVVEVAAGQGIALALRADGTWVGWGTNKDGILDNLDSLKGVRWLSIGGGYSSTRFLVGIRPEPGDLKKR